MHCSNVTPKCPFDLSAFTLLISLRQNAIASRTSSRQGSPSGGIGQFSSSSSSWSWCGTQFFGGVKVGSWGVTMGGSSGGKGEGNAPGGGIISGGNGIEPGGCIHGLGINSKGTS